MLFLIVVIIGLIALWGLLGLMAIVFRAFDGKDDFWSWWEPCDETYLAYIITLPGLIVIALWDFVIVPAVVRVVKTRPKSALERFVIGVRYRLETAKNSGETLQTIAKQLKRLKRLERQLQRQLERYDDDRLPDADVLKEELTRKLEVTTRAIDRLENLRKQIVAEAAKQAARSLAPTHLLREADACQAEADELINQAAAQLAALQELKSSDG